MKSTLDRYGTVAISIHWISAILILALLGSGFRATNAMDAAAKAGLLRFHIPVAIVVLFLTIFRIVWWRFDLKPLPMKGSPAWQERIARWVHLAFYIVILGMIASGIGMMILSGATPAVFGEAGAALPNFTDYPPRAPHGLGAFLLVGLLIFHAGAALYHQFVRHDGLLWRMWYGG
ncbi:cytochrome b/b6 domain-containing protein [Agrobacterium sp. SHOUNA12C]|uniref:Cytochrome b561 n=1 Tax=Rhizobium rhizogenes NBRC 13257 TaxID=1220581 RepID=A0AA87Q1P7_RHIRH|nr:cytochrome b/b6 domain-containing protein [Rhizobium rhizogenes]MCJ9722965.1 cytochrome b/b6 domain-containing protein [Agrobacterium sp. BETTINA12B]MCJ9758085.1 cytochrome b/b6 domain-containing protein [Agrobacterium sp. SHOUNA12C]NTF58010.1 cytochrome b [Rhizobium rhizogenes]NTF77592.1 cytochrome b [Rhizobium rhizogenes]NTF96520.1 cytochrome b [Rhizobium rhizogenes]